MRKEYVVYIMTNKHNSVLYTGVTNNLSRRAYDHAMRLHSGFTNKYNVNKVVYMELFWEIGDAIARETQIPSGMICSPNRVAKARKQQ